MSDPRKIILSDRLQRLQTLAAQAREQLAAELLSLDTVLAAAAKAAAEGFDSVTVDPPRAVDLRDTEVWRTTEPRLRDMGFSTEASVKVGNDGRSRWLFTVLWRRELTT